MWVTNLLWLRGESYPIALYETITVVAVVADVWKMVRKWRKARAEDEPTVTYEWLGETTPTKLIEHGN
jgi:hypothetical protein